MSPAGSGPAQHTIPRSARRPGSPPRTARQSSWSAVLVPPRTSRWELVERLHRSRSSPAKASPGPRVKRGPGYARAPQAPVSPPGKHAYPVVWADRSIPARSVRSFRHGSLRSSGPHPCLERHAQRVWDGTHVRAPRPRPRPSPPGTVHTWGATGDSASTEPRRDRERAGQGSRSSSGTPRAFRIGVPDVPDRALGVHPRASPEASNHRRSQ